MISIRIGSEAVCFILIFCPIVSEVYVVLKGTKKIDRVSKGVDPSAKQSIIIGENL